MSATSETRRRRLRVGRLKLEIPGADSAEAQRFARRLAELLGQGLAGGSEVRPRKEAIVDIAIPAGAVGEKLTEFLAREIRRRLG